MKDGVNETPAPHSPQPPTADPAWAPPPAGAPVSWGAPSVAPPVPMPGHRRRVLLRAALIAVPAAVVVAGVASVVTLAVAGDGHSTSGAGSAAGRGGDHTTTGTLTAQNGSSWQVKTAKGTTVTVHLDPSTTYGTKAHPSDADAFHDGSKVRVVGTGQGGSLDAVRVVGLGHHAAPSI
jgi:hypothetical protein